MGNQRNVSIQILRVMACIMVFAVHFGQRVNLSGAIRLFTDFGAFGVQLFLLISGFFAGKTFFRKQDVDVFTYYKKRIIAIFPLYYLVILYYFISENILNHFVSVIPTDEFGVGWFRYIFILNGFINSDTYFWSNLGITWTIPIFVFFYLIAPWILKRINTVFSSVLVWISIFAITKILSTFYSCVIFDKLHLLFLGVVIYACIHRKYSLPAASAFLVLALFMMILGKNSHAYVFIFSCLLLTMATWENILLPKWLQRLVNVLDKYSYTLYLMHGVVFCSLLDRLNVLGVSKIIIAIIALVGTFLATWIVGKFIEKPIQQFLTKHLLK